MPKVLICFEPSPDLSPELMADAGAPGVRFLAWIFRRGMTVARLAGRVAGVPRAPGLLPWVAGMTSGWSGGLRERVDPLPRGGDGLRPWPGGLDLQAAAPS